MASLRCQEIYPDTQQQLQIPQSSPQHLQQASHWLAAVYAAWLGYPAAAEKVAAQQAWDEECVSKVCC